MPIEDRNAAQNRHSSSRRPGSPSASSSLWCSCYRLPQLRFGKRRRGWQIGATLAMVPAAAEAFWGEGARRFPDVANRSEFPEVER